MSETMPLLTYTLIGLNAYVSYRGFKSPHFLERFKFEVGAIQRGDYQRIVTSAFLHGDGHHLFFNMVALFCFGEGLEAQYHPAVFATIYFLSMLGGGFLSLFMHRHNPDYSAVGASGAVSGLVFAAIFLRPGTPIGFLFLPISIPGWAFALAYTGYSLWGMKKRSGNIGHDAHMGGAITGMIVAAAVAPDLVLQNITLFLVILSLFSAFLISYMYNPLMLSRGSAAPIDIKQLKRMVTKSPKKKKRKMNDTKTEEKEAKRLREEMDKLLVKVHESGMDGLTPQEKARLEAISKELRDGK
jgi:membrane associated rhomboid family serine protease